MFLVHIQVVFPIAFDASVHAIREATRDGAPPIDLLDGEQLADKLKELGLGIKTDMVENVTVLEDWFKNI